MMHVYERKVAECWSANADLWTALIRGKRDAVREMFIVPAFLDEFVGSVQGMRGIDLCCGEGSSSRLLAERGASMVGVDISHRLIQAATALEAEEKRGIRYVCCSAADLNLVPDCSFDFAVSMMALMDAPRLGDIVNEAYRVLSPGGRFFACVLHPDSWSLSQPDPRSREGFPSVEAVLEDCVFPTVDGAGEITLQILRFPYHIEDYTNAVAGAGFGHLRIWEPKASPALARQVPRLFENLRRSPLILCLSGAKD